MLTPFSSSYEILQEVYADLLVMREVEADVDGEEVVDLALGPRW